MNLKTYCNVTIAGRVITDPVVDHEVYDKRFLALKIDCKRTSDTSDIINIIVEEQVAGNVKKGDFIKVNGSIRSKNFFESDKRRLFVYVFANKLEILGEELYENTVDMIAHICKVPVLRTTPLGKQITDIMLVVNRRDNKSDYIPAIAWNKNAKSSSMYSVGDMVKITGRFQSRDYVKVIDGKEETRTAYELSIFSITNLTNMQKSNLKTEAVG